MMNSHKINKEQKQEEEDKKAEELETQREEDAKGEDGAARDYISEIISDLTHKEMEKTYKMYNKETITKLLRILDVFTSIATLNDAFKAYAINTFSSEVISVLLDLSMTCRSSHGVIILSIFKNLLKSKFIKLNRIILL